MILLELIGLEYYDKPRSKLRSSEASILEPVFLSLSCWKDETAKAEAQKKARLGLGFRLDQKYRKDAHVPSLFKDPYYHKA